MLALTFPQHEDTSVYCLRLREARLRIRNSTVVHVHSAGLHEPPRFAFRRSELHAGYEIDHSYPLTRQLVRRELHRWDILEHRKHIAHLERRDVLGEHQT